MKKILSVIIIVCFCMVSAGCWDSKEIDELALITSMGIDKIKDQYILTTQVVNPSMIAAQKGGGNQAPVVTYKTKGKSISEALQKRTTMSDRENYTAQMKVLVIGESLAREGIGDILDFLSRSRGIEPIFYITIAKGNTAANILEVMTPFSKSPADLIFASIKTQIKTKGAVIGTMADDLIANLSNQGEEAKLTGIEIIGSKDKGGEEENVKKIAPNTFLKINNIGVFHRDKLVGWLTEKESIGLNFTLNKMEKSRIGIPCPSQPQKRVNLEVLHTKTSVKSETKNNHPLIHMKVHTALTLDEVQCESLQIHDPQTIKKLNILSQKEIKKIIEAAVFATQKKYKTDALEFGRAVYRADPDFWYRNKTKWDKLFIELPVKIQNEAIVTFTGTVNNSLLKEMKE